MTDGCGKYYRTAKTPIARKNKAKSDKIVTLREISSVTRPQAAKRPQILRVNGVKYSHGASDMHALHNYVAIASAV